MAGTSIAHLVRALPLLGIACLTLMIVSDTAASRGRACSAAPAAPAAPAASHAVATTTIDPSGEWFGLEDGAVATWRQAQAAGAWAGQAYDVAWSAGCVLDGIDLPARHGRW